MSEKEIADWIVNTCLSFGTTTATAYKVAGLFVEGVTKELAQPLTSIAETQAQEPGR